MPEAQLIQDKILQITISLRLFHIHYDHLIETRTKHNEKLFQLIINKKCTLKHNRRYKNVYKKTAAVQAQIDKLKNEKKDLQNRLQTIVEYELSTICIT